MIGENVAARVGELLKEAAAWRLLGRLFECPSDSWRQEIDILARELGDADLTAAASAAAETATEGQYHSVFGPGGPAPPREATYRETLELGSLMSELNAYYHAFAYQPQIPESPDHVAVEINFIGYLKLKEAYALATGDVEASTVASRAAAQFIADHLRTITDPLAEVLAGSHLDYIAQTSRILAARVGPGRRPRRLTILDTFGEDDQEDLQCAPP